MKRRTSIMLLTALLLVVMVFSQVGESFAAVDISSPSTTSSMENEWRQPEVPDALKDYYVFVASGDAFTDITGLEVGSLYKRHDTTGETTLLASGPINAVRFYDNRILYSKGNQIISIDTDGNDPFTVYEGDMEVEYFTPGDGLLLFESDDILYRVNLKTGLIDSVCELNGILYYEPYSATTLHILSVDEELLMDMDTGDCTEYAEEEMETAANDLAHPLTTAAATSYTINGVAVPVRIPNYNANGVIPPQKSSRTYKSGTFSDGDTYFTISGKAGTDSLECNSAWECAGFAQYVYSEIWGSCTYGHSHTYASSHNLNETSAKTFYQSLGAGANVRLYSTTRTGHSIIVLSASSTGIDVYEANRPGSCIVRLSTIEYNNLPSKFKVIVNFRTPNVSAGSSGHRACPVSSCSSYNVITPHYKNGNPGYGTCSECGYVGNIPIGTTGIIPEIN